MNTFNFPFTTCEKIRDGFVKQPYSVIVNIISCIMLFYFLYISKSIHVRIMLLVFITFQLWHTFSHMYHINSNIQSTVIHSISYAISFATLNALLYLSKTTMTYYYIAILIILVMIDIYLWIYVGGIWSVFANISILAFIIFGNYNILPSFFKKAIPWLFITLLLLVALEINELMNCEKMLENYVFPYHIFIELIGLYIFTYLAYLFTKWEK